jgi:hypothetical protein
MVDVIQDTSIMLNDLLTPSQRRAINTIHRGNAASRNKYCLICADKVDPVMKAEKFKDRGEYENELRQVLGEIRIAQDIGISGDLVIIGSVGMLIVGRKLRKYDRITVVFGEVMGIQSFMVNFYGRVTILMGDIVKLKRFLECGDENPEFFESVRQLRNSVSTDLAVLEEMVTYLDDALAALQIPQVPIEDVGKILYDTVDIKAGIAALDSQLHDIRKLVRGSRMSMDRLSREIRILQTKNERTVGLAIEQNTQRMVEVSHATRRTSAVYGILRILLGCSFGLLFLDAFISARAKYFGISKMYPPSEEAVGETSFDIDFAAAANVEMGDPTAGGSYFPMQIAIIFDQAPFVGTFCSHMIFMGIFVALMRRMEAFFDASGTRAVSFFVRASSWGAQVFVCLCVCCCIFGLFSTRTTP